MDENLLNWFIEKIRKELEQEAKSKEKFLELLKNKPKEVEVHLRRLMLSGSIVAIACTELCVPVISDTENDPPIIVERLKEIFLK
jgi:hypothetical protein